MKKYFSVKMVALMIAVALITLFATPVSVFASNGELRIHMLKVGDGRADCFIVDLPNNQKMVIDVPNGGATKLINKLNALGYGGGIKYLVGTHNHADHLGGMDDFLNSGFNINNTEIYYPKGSIVTGDADYNNMVQAANNRGLNIKKLQRGDVILNTTVNGKQLLVSVLGPVGYRCDGGSDDYDSINNGSLALRIKYGARGAIFMADCLTGPEQDILAQTDEPALWGQFLKVGHHGIASAGNIGCSEPFLDAFNLKFAFISNDDANINSTIKSRLQARGVKYWVVGETGDVSIACTADTGWQADKDPTWQP